MKLSGDAIVANGQVLKKDRAEMTFSSGQFYLEAPVAGKVRGAIFLGKGSFRAEPPPSTFEKESVKRILNRDVVDSDFAVAVLRFNDDTAAQLGAVQTGVPIPDEAQKLASSFEPQLLKETAMNVSARLALAILNQEPAGFFLAQFDKGKRDRFGVLLDYQCRLMSDTFGVNGGEKGVIYETRGVWPGVDVWMAFYSLEDYARGTVDYSDRFDLVDTPTYSIQADLRSPAKDLKAEMRMELRALAGGLRAIPFVLSEGLPEWRDLRKQKAMRVQWAKLADGTPLDFAQEEWEGGLLLFLPKAIAKDERISVTMAVAGEFMDTSEFIRGSYFPYLNGQWYPRHGYLRRSLFDLSFRHQKRHRVGASGRRVQEGPANDGSGDIITAWKVEQPVALVMFAVGEYEVHTAEVEISKRKLPIEYFAITGAILPTKEDFIVTELKNTAMYFDALFGDYPYPKFGAAYHPWGFGQGFASFLVFPRSDRASKYTYAFIAHETAHQWWGNIVGWRSYRDQWLSEGFAEYSGILYTEKRDSRKAALDLIDDLRRSLLFPPFGQRTGVGRGRLNDIGPIVLGHRLSTRETAGAYQVLIYNKGALVMRMLHFLMSDPATGNGQPFYTMMTDFVNRHRNGSATTESFRDIAGEHFARTPIARKYGMKDLNWFFEQWVYQTSLPMYRLEYQIEDQPDGSALVKGTLYQDKAPENWVMPLPLIFRLPGDQVARGTVAAIGPSTPVQIKLPKRPTKVELDPDVWVISEKTETKAK